MGKAVQTSSTSTAVGRPVELSPRRIMRTLLAPEAERERWMAIYHQAKGLRVPPDAWKEPADHVEAARAVVAAVPASLAEMEAGLAALHEVRREACSDVQLDLLLAVMVDGYPNARPASLSGYLDSLFLCIAEENRDRGARSDRAPPAKISASTVAVAVRQVWSEHKFPPSPAELLAACRTAQANIEASIGALRRLTDARDDAEAVLIAAGEMADFSDRSGEGPALLDEYRQLKAGAKPD